MAGSVPSPHTVVEDGARFLVHLLKGQNHGFFPDMAAGGAGCANTLPPVRASGCSIFSRTPVLSRLSRYRPVPSWW